MSGVAGLVRALGGSKARQDRARAVLDWMGDVEAVRASVDADPDALRYELAAAGLPVADIGRVLRRVERERSGLRVAAPDERRGRDVLEIEDVEVTLPDGYALGPGARILRCGEGEDGRDVVVAHRPIAITGRWVDEESGREVVDVQWMDEDGWRLVTVPRSRAMDARQIVGLADMGAPVASTSASEVVRYLRAQVEGLDGVPGVAVSRSGWVGRDFVAGGSTVLGAAPVRVVADDGAAQLAEAVAQVGTWEGWCEAIRPVSHLPRVMVAVWAAVAASMLRPLGVEGGAVIHWSARSSQGKTTALRAAWSVWGDPSSAAGGIGSWDATAKWIEERAAYSCDMPVLLDETSHIPAKGQETAARLVYALASGQGRGRGTRGGSEAVSTYRTVVLSTGEAPITSWCAQEGVAARTIELHGAPCESAEQSRALLWAITDHHGHLGPRAVAWLASADWRALRARYRARVAEWSERAAPGGIAARLAAVVALLEAAGRVCTLLGVPGDPEPVLAHLWERVHEQAREADEGARALSVVRARLAQHYGEIVRETVTGEPRDVTVSGRAIGREVRGTVHVSTVAVDGWLREVGMDRAAVERTLMEQGRIARGRSTVAGQKIHVWIIASED